jgi:hypothetical protein
VVCQSVKEKHKVGDQGGDVHGERRSADTLTSMQVRLRTFASAFSSLSSGWPARGKSKVGRHAQCSVMVNREGPGRTQVWKKWLNIYGCKYPHGDNCPRPRRGIPPGQVTSKPRTSIKVAMSFA